jgi:conjugative relaxase-like TrwC/TraI family protein
LQIHPITKSDFSYYFIDELIDRVESVGVEIGGSRIRSGISQIPKGMSISEAAEELDSLCSSRRLYIAVDLVVAAPKSVSILWALSTDTIRRQIEICHEKALCRALEYYEVTENWTSSKGEVIGGSGVTAYEFRHRISRSADPHLHSHVVLLNATQYGNDIKALNLTRLRRALPALEALYRFEFAQVLFETTGFSLRGEILGTLLLPGLNETAIDQF